MKNFFMFYIFIALKQRFCYYFLSDSLKRTIFAHKLEYMNTNIVETIQTRLDSMGMSQAQFAECVSATPAQMSIFLREKGSLSIDCLNKSLDLVGVNLSLYSKRSILAREVAEYLLEKTFLLLIIGQKRFGYFYST